MATFSSKQQKRQGFVNPIFALASITLIGILMVFGPLSGNMYPTVRDTLGIEVGAPSGLSINNQVSFFSDAQYWDASCAHGWKADSTCDTIFSRAQSCSIGTASAYCSAYDTYLEQFR